MKSPLISSESQSGDGRLRTWCVCFSSFALFLLFLCAVTDLGLERAIKQDALGVTSDEVASDDALVPIDTSHVPRGQRIIFQDTLDISMEQLEKDFILNTDFHKSLLISLGYRVLDTPPWVNKGGYWERSNVQFWRPIPVGKDGLQISMDVTYHPFPNTKKEAMISKSALSESAEYREYTPIGNDKVQILIYGSVRMPYLLRLFQRFADAEQKVATVRYFELLRQQLDASSAPQLTEHMEETGPST